jgi:rhodanese-related sulfurtransferase
MSARRSLASLALAALALLVAGGCRTIFEGQPFRPTVTPGVAFSMLRDAPYLPILDLRPADQFHGPLGHMAGARSIPLDSLAAHRVELRAYEGVTVLAYCSAGECGKVEHARLVEWGPEDAVLIDGGLAAWVAAGYGTVHRAAPLSMPTDGPLPEDVAEEILEEAAPPPDG